MKTRPLYNTELGCIKNFTVWNSVCEIPYVEAEFVDGFFELNFKGNLPIFMNEFPKRLEDFVKNVVSDYNKYVHPKDDYEECFDSMVADMDTIYPAIYTWKKRTKED